MFLKMLYVFIALGHKHLSQSDLRKMFGNDRVLSEDWLKDVTSYNEVVHFLRTLHFEDSMDPTDERGGTNYRPNCVPKVGLLLEMFRQQSITFTPPGPADYSHDETTSYYGDHRCGFMHKQPQKPHPGIRIYSVNHSQSFYLKNFQVDLRDKKTIEQMFREVVGPALRDSGVKLFADNAFVSTVQYRWCTENGINFSVTTRTSYGFPKSLIKGPDAPTRKGEWSFAMSKDGLIASSWIGN